MGARDKSSFGDMPGWGALGRPQNPLGRTISSFLFFHSLTLSRRKAPFGAHVSLTPVPAPAGSLQSQDSPQWATPGWNETPCGLIVPVMCPFYLWQVLLVFHLH